MAKSPVPVTLATHAKNSDLWGAAILGLGSVASKILTVGEHLDFLVSIKEEHFKVALRFLGLHRLVARIARGFRLGDLPIHSRPECSIVLSKLGHRCFCIADRICFWVFSHHEIFWPNAKSYCFLGLPCNALIDTSRLAYFRDSHKLGLICFVDDPKPDAMDNKDILISNLFTINLAGLAIMVPQALPNT